MTTCLRIALSTSLIVVTGTGAASAQDRPAACAPRDALVRQLETNYGEARRAVGLRDRAGVIEIFASDATGTWTIVLSRPDGLACAIAAGEAWHELADVSLDPEA